MDLNLLIEKYWWLFLTLIAIIGFYFYSKLDAYSKQRAKKIFNKKTLIIIGLAAGWFFWNKYGGSAEVTHANRWMPIICMAFYLGYLQLQSWRYQTQQFISPNIHGSFSRPPAQVDGFLVFALDTINVGVPIDSAKRIAVVRKETAELFLRGAVSIANLDKSSKYELPDNVRIFIERNKDMKGATDEIYYGWFDSIERVDWSLKQLKELEKAKQKPGLFNLLKKELGVENPSISTLLWLYKNNCKSTGKQTEMFDSAVEAVEKGVEHQKRIKDAYVGKEEKNMEGGHEQE